MEITHYFAIARRWMWMLILGLALGVIGGYVIAKLQTPVYQASTRVVVSRASMQSASGASSNSSGIYDFFLSDQILIQTYVELLKASSIYDHVSQIVGYPVSAGQVSAEQVSETRIISITVEDTNPQRVADIANAVVQALIAQNEDLEAGRYKASDESLQVQIRQLEDQIAKLQTDLENLSTVSVDEQIVEVEKQMAPLQAEVTQLQKDIAILTPAWSSERKSKVTELQARLDQIQPLLTLYQQIYTNLTVSGTSGTADSNTTNNPNAARLEKTLTLYQQIYLNLINTREAVRLARMQNTQSVNQIEPAVPPGGPIRPIPTQSAFLGGIIGLALVGGIVFLIEFLDDTIKAPEDVERLLEIPVIGYIANAAADANNNGNNNEIYVATQPRSPIAEAFRSLRTNLEFASVDKPLRTILVTSAEASDGKSTVAANLAAIFAQGGKRVMLIDCDLRRPRVHRFIEVQNRMGMTDLFRGSHTLDEVTHKWTDSGSMEILVITSGSLPPNPAELLGSLKMDHILEEIAARVDVVIIDSPPSMVADAQVLAAKVDGVVMVVQPGKTHAGAIRATREQLSRAGAHIIGAVFNRIPREHGYYYGGYRYYSPYYYQNNKYLNDTSLNSRFGQHSLEPDENPSIFRKMLNLVNRREETEEIPRLPVRKNVLNPAGWDSEKTNALDQPAKEENKEPDQFSFLAEETDDQKKNDPAPQKAVDEKRKKAAAGGLIRKAAKQISLPQSTPRKSSAKTPTQASLLRALAQKTPAAPMVKTQTPLMIFRSSNTTSSGKIAVADASVPRHLYERLIGTDHKFLIEKAPIDRNLNYYAAKYKTDLNSIAAVNYKMPAPAWIIPVGFTDVAKLPSFLAYEVKEKGITIETLARNLKVNLPDLKYYNGITDMEKILTTQWLLIPQNALPALDSPALTNASKKHQLDAPIGVEQKFVIHKITGDENLHQYASLYKTSLEAIITITVNPPLWSGTLAVIPVGLTDVTSLPRFETHQVQVTTRAIEDLAQELKVDPLKLKQYNDIIPGEQLQSGDWLIVPRSKSSALWRSASSKPNNLHNITA